MCWDYLNLNNKKKRIHKIHSESNFQLYPNCNQSFYLNLLHVLWVWWFFANQILTHRLRDSITELTIVCSIINCFDQTIWYCIQYQIVWSIALCKTQTKRPFLTLPSACGRAKLPRTEICSVRLFPSFYGMNIYDKFVHLR